MLRLLERCLIACLILMACSILYNLGEYGIQKLIEGDVSLKPKGWATKPHGGKYGD